MPLLRELLVRSASLPLLCAEGGANSRLVMVLLDELAAAQDGLAGGAGNDGCLGEAGRSERGDLS
jgi:hypothetical protein